MNNKKIYTAISIIIGLVLLYTAGTFIYHGYDHLLQFTAITYIRQIPVLLGLAGVIMFYTSNFKRNNLLRWFMCFQLFSFPFKIWFDIKYFSGSPLQYDITESGSRLTTGAMINLFIALLFTVNCAIGLWLLSKEKTAKLIAAEYDGKITWEFEPAGKPLRFINRLIDIIIMLFIVLTNLFSMVTFFEGSFNPNSYWELYLTELFFLIFYYLLLEGIFNTTPGKCATNTVIINENGERPNFGQILGRTFARLIPFDALSFFSARGWHDSLSGTYVVCAANNETATDEITLDAEKNMAP